MSLQVLTVLVVGATFVLYIYIAIRSKAKDTSDFYVASKGVHPVLNGMATGADWMSAASFISMAGLIAFLGYDGAVYLMGWTGGYCLLAMLLAPYLRKFGKFTVSEFIGERYYSNFARMVAVACLITASVTYVIGQMKGIGVVFSRSLGVSFEVGIVIGMIIVFIYAVFGGMKGVTNTQIAQYCVLIFAYTVPAIFIALQLTGMPIPQLGLGSTMSDGSGVYLLDKLDGILTELGFAAYTAQKMSTINVLFLTMSLMIGTAGLPHVIMRFFTVPSVKDARASAGWALVFIAILYTTAPAVGAMARMNLMQTIQHGPVGSIDGNIEYAKVPAWFKSWEKTGLLKFEDKNGDGRIQYYDEKGLKTAESFGWKGNEMIKVDRDIMVLANPEIAGLPNWVVALVTAGGIAAALSTAAGLLLAIATAISHDVLKGWLMPDIDDQQELKFSRIAIGGAILVAGYLGLNPPGFAAQVVALAFGLAASSIFPAIMMGIFSKRVNDKGAIAGMIAGLGSTLIYIFVFKGWFFFKSTAMLPDNADNWLFGLNPQSFGTVGAIINFIVAYVVSFATEPPPQRIQDLIEDIRVPIASK
ncbi:MAG: cation acetate symporter [Desulfobacula sp.]|jgi:cation/acetate symporter|uniref:sodium:solute symporter family protein n=1 Tax=Desulfobacula sp. TaxID=2593537 RepID=UPI001D50EF9C|nr:cation acetate symporter [Desulfobacula sp.]MBT3486689.1 cation acetate symporter [Desulfobacula sp.]MBT3802966.1 cation acetate symporter [Desulfobacula sp.]MBT4023521.1 cation acetate symporter [Desulfobacula sp.]MBT4197014.1 cation acetate symporter [Desulfobacula sp.]